MKRTVISSVLFILGIIFYYTPASVSLLFFLYIEYLINSPISIPELVQIGLPLVGSVLILQEYLKNRRLEQKNLFTAVIFWIYLSVVLFFIITKVFIPPVNAVTFTCQNSFIEYTYDGGGFRNRCITSVAKNTKTYSYCSLLSNKDAEGCIRSVALERKDFSGPEIEKLSTPSKDLLYSEAVFYYKEDVGLCNKLSSNAARIVCSYQYHEQKKLLNVNICNTLKEEQEAQKVFYFSCMSQVIGDDVDCLLAPEKSTDRNACFEKKGMCYAINNGTKNECFVRNRVNIDTMCSVLKSVESRNDCYIGAAIANDDIRICSNLSETRDENFLNRDYCRVVITKPGERTKAFCNTLAPDSREGCLLDAVK